MSTLKRFKVQDWAGVAEVILEVDLQILTVEVATEINEFLTDPRDRMAEERGDAIRVAVRLFGAYALREMLSDGGAEFDGAVTGDQWSKRVQSYEGMGGCNPAPFGWCGIRVVGANVSVPDFGLVTLEEVTS